MNCGNDLWIHDNTIIYNHVGNELADQVTAVENRILPLLVHSVCPFLKFDDKSVLVELFVQTRLEFIQYGHGCAYDFVREFFVFHGGIFNHGFHGFHGFLFLLSVLSVLSVSSVVLFRLSPHDSFQAFSGNLEL